VLGNLSRDTSELCVWSAVGFGGSCGVPFPPNDIFAAANDLTKRCALPHSPRAEWSLSPQITIFPPLTGTVFVPPHEDIQNLCPA